jgi:SAM-dependent methyltransferase
MTSPFRNPDTQVKITPDTYIHFDGSDHIHLRNVMCEEAIRIKYDILLILYDLVDWKTVGELIAPWPPDDQEKIIASLESMYQGKVVMLESDVRSNAPDPTTPLSQNLLGSGIHINVENHHVMLRDVVRLAAYRRAIERAVTPETVALDLGCGTGILSFFAAKAGAQKIYAIEKRPDIILLAHELAKANGLEQIDFIEGASTQIPTDRLGSPQPSLLISEILGNGILEENVLEFTLDARNRLLAPGSQLIPWKLDIYVFAFQSELKPDRWLEVAEFQDLYGFDFTLFGQVLCNKATLSLDRYNPLLNKTMSEPLLVKSLDLTTLDSALFSEQFSLPIKYNGTVTGVCAYFKAYLDETTTLTNSPWAPQTHWTQLIYSLPVAKPVSEGDTWPLLMTYDGTLRIRLVD